MLEQKSTPSLDKKEPVSRHYFENRNKCCYKYLYISILQKEQKIEYFQKKLKVFYQQQYLPTVEHAREAR